MEIPMEIFLESLLKMAKSSSYLTVRHGKSPFFIGKPSISMGHLYNGYVN
jgi:hypothetical protein